MLKLVLLCLPIFFVCCNYTELKEPRDGEGPHKKTPLPTPAVEPILVTYQRLKDEVLSQHCLPCHNNSDAQGGVDLSSYSSIMAGDQVVPGSLGQSTMHQQVVDGEMPPSPHTSLNEKEISLVNQWIAEGCQE